MAAIFIDYIMFEILYSSSFHYFDVFLFIVITILLCNLNHTRVWSREERKSAVVHRKIYTESLPLSFIAICYSAKGQPWFILFGIPCYRYRLTRIVVDNEAGPNKNQTVVFLGSEKGIILKFLAKMNSGFLKDSLFLEELNVYNPDKYVALVGSCVCGAQEMDRNRETHGYSCYKRKEVNFCICVC